MAKPVLSRLVVATHNPKKAREMITILSERFPRLEILTLADFAGAPEPEESGSSYAENAVIKAESAAVNTREWCLADDAGLEIDELNGEPGLHSKRFAGEQTPFSEKIDRILQLMQGLPSDRRSARFRCFVALAPPPGTDAEGTVLSAFCEGRIADHPSGAGGFGYDPIFFLPDLGVTMAELTPHEKHAVSHRGKVLRQLAEYIEANFAPV